MLGHTHPGGDPAPSAQDVAATKDRVAAGHVLGIPVIDHVILGRRTADRPKDYVSFREEGLL